MRMAKELENKSTEDEMKVSENNVTIENLTMNVAMQNRTVVNMMEDRKYTYFNMSSLNFSSFILFSDLSFKKTLTNNGLCLK